MPNSDGASQHMADLQERMLRLAGRDYGLSLKVLSAETRIPERTLRNYMAGAMMPVHVFRELCRVIPDELTSLLMPTGKHVGTDEPGDGDETALAREAAGYSAEYLNSTDPASEAGPALSPRERANLKDRARRLGAVALKVAA